MNRVPELVKNTNVNNFWATARMVLSFSLWVGTLQNAPLLVAGHFSYCPGLTNSLNLYKSQNTVLEKKYWGQINYPQ